MTDDERTPQWPAAVAAIIAAKSPATQRSYRAAWASWLAHLGDCAPEVATRAQVRGWLRELCALNSPATARARLGACSAIWRAALAAGWLTGAPADLFTRNGAALYCARRG